MEGFDDDDWDLRLSSVDDLRCAIQPHCSRTTTFRREASDESLCFRKGKKRGRRIIVDTASGACSFGGQNLENISLSEDSVGELAAKQALTVPGRPKKVPRPSDATCHQYTFTTNSAGGTVHVGAIGLVMPEERYFLESTLKEYGITYNLDEVITSSKHNRPELLAGFKKHGLVEKRAPRVNVVAKSDVVKKPTNEEEENTLFLF